MEIVWDERKRLVNLDKHGMDFDTLEFDFFEQAVVLSAKNGRSMAIGRLDGIITVVFVKLGTEALSVISMRPASISERRLI